MTVNGMNTFVDNVILCFFKSLGKVSNPVAINLCRILGGSWFRLDRKRRHICLGNLERAYGTSLPPNQRRHLARAVFNTMPRLLFDIGWALNHSPDQVRRRIRVIGLQHLEAAHALGRGVLVLTAHLGCWELFNHVATVLPRAAVYRPLDFQPLNRFFESFRCRLGGHLIHRRHGMRPILRSLYKGECVYILLDQSIGHNKGVFVNFFGHPACTNKGLALLALKTRAPVVPAFLVRSENGFIAEFGPALALIRTGNRSADVRANTALYNRVIENKIRQYPEQWFWVHNRWKHKPA